MQQTVSHNNDRTNAEKKSPVWHCLVKHQVIFCIATTVTIVLTPHRQIVAVEAFNTNQQETAEQSSNVLPSQDTPGHAKPADDAEGRAGGGTESGPTNSPTIESQQQDQQQRVPKKRQDELLEFVKEHHPELVKLLQHLKKNRRGEFNEAMLDLDRSEQRISLFKDRNPQRYQIELNLWKTRSRIRMLVAQLSVEDNQRQQRQLKQEVSQFFKLRKQQLLSDKERTEERLNRINENIEKFDSEGDELIERQFQAYLRNAERQRKQNSDDKDSNAKSAAAKKQNAKRNDKQSDRQKNADKQKTNDKNSADDK